MAENSDKKDRLVKVAAKIFGKNGYHGTHMSEVAREAKVSPKTLYQYFDSKQALFIEVRRWAADQLRGDIMAQLMETNETGLTAIRNLMKSYGKFMHKNRGPTRIMAEAVAIVDGDVREEQKSQFLESSELLRTVLEDDIGSGLLETPGDPGDIARNFLGFTSILAYFLLLDMDKKRLGDFNPDYALGLFFDAIKQ